MVARGRQQWMLGLVAAGALAGIVGFAGVATQGRAESPKPTEPPAAAPETPTQAPTSAPTPPPERTPVEGPLSRPFGPISAEPHRAFTGDGDCLNVRPVPGTTFESDPRTCVPEGFLLWLHGDPVQVDGREWRYALGEGWVATEFVRPAPGAATGFGPFQSVTVSAAAGEVTKLATVSSSGAVSELPRLPAIAQGLGGVSPLLSPDGKWGAYGQEKRYVPTLVVRDMQSGTEQIFPNAHLASWGPANRLLVRVNVNCPNDCRWSTGWLDPREGVIHQLGDTMNDWGLYTWANDGLSFYAVEKVQLVRVWLEGRIEQVPTPGVTAWGEMSLSADGRRLVVSPFQGDISIIDLETGAVSKVPRAKQVFVGGRCGGGGSSLTTWLDASTVIWHESYAEKGNNGITISRTDGSGRRLIPFFTVSDIRAVAPNLVSFVTYENPSPKGEPGFVLTWLLDTTTNEARPVTVGAAPQWQ